ncbi:bifunctional pyr operon transcriptional regulator/uracil phosphoribosyltransferase PyrR [Salsipaludibacter albus]|uniref:bifunctional pyr operon transcriptional regulator/uracil phosphoribosyltransferase PyrR n=1 Tax=Salsipaludibacter albus TaxID=2849650 RepID=UPI001EE4A78F|nr:bifunctional pyr operon transcriptional regulator/uracil phosphoribosyltransferase PyrR [Salsipaludibacter albus]MBY5164039.1 bifunctional pyr operon transcriptional regulator/uracil phosphoribosyltransferase PyrR [Salsipaludibacter albus]
MSRLLDADDIRRALRRLAHELVEANHGADGLVLMGIQTRGVPLARRLAANIGEIEDVEVPVGPLDVTLYRDDVASRPPRALADTRFPVDVDGTTVVIVDDVLFTGRTIRAAMDAILDVGRPDAIRLVTLVDRGHRELPIRADHVGKNLPTALAERISVRLAEIDDVDEVVLEAVPTHDPAPAGESGARA